jgi:hypothetical protein
MSITEYASRSFPKHCLMAFCESEGPLRTFLSSAVSRLVLAAVLLPLAGCIAHAPGSGGSSTGTTTVTVTPTSATVGGGSTTTFTATVTGPQETAVTWNVNGIQNGNSTIGTMTAGSSSGGTATAVYLAPTTVPTPNTVSVTAVSVAPGGTTSSPSTVTITPSTVNVTVAPTTAAISAGGQQQFTATVTGTTNTTVGWYVDTIQGGNSTTGPGAVGIISPTGLYTAPASVNNTAQVTVMAEAQADTSKTATATVNITGTSISIAAVPATTSVPVQVPAGGTQEFQATVTGNTNTTVQNWTVTCPPTVTSCGTIASTGSTTAVYTAPASVTTVPYTVTIVASPAADTSLTGQILANVHVTVSVTPATDTIGQGANLLYTATVNGAPTASTGVSWAVTSANGGAFVPIADTTGIPSNQGIYIAPSLSQGQTTLPATISAVSQFDSQQSGTTTVTVQETDPLGTVTGFQPFSGTCPTAAEDSNNASCYQMTVSCDQVAPWTTYLKVNTPSQNPPLGTVIFATDGGGTNLYDTEYTYGSTTVGDLVTDGYTTAQVSFGGPPFDNGANPNGWLTGPGGVRRLACRFATVANWIYNNPQMLNSNATSTAPLCATGNGAGGGAIAFAVSEYGLNGLNASNGVNANLKMVELTSGPNLTALAQGCFCSPVTLGPPGAPCNQDQGLGPSAQQPMCYTGGQTTIDAAYSQPTVCSGGNANNTLLLTSDSIYYQPGKSAVFPLTNTTVSQRFGALDLGAGEPQGWQWNKGVSLTTPVQACEASGSQPLANDLTSATDIANDIKSMCK